MDNFWEAVGKLVATGGGAAIVTYGLVQWLGKRWIENQFNERLEKFKSDQQAVVARLRVEIESTLSGVLKVQEREFAVLPAIWEKLDFAYGVASALCAPLTRTLDIHGISDLAMEEVMTAQEMTESQKRRLRAVKGIERQTLYTDIRFSSRLHDAEDHAREYSRYIAANAIFLPETLMIELRALEGVLWTALTDKEKALNENSDELHRTARMTLEGPGKETVAAVEHSIRSRLKSHMKAASENSRV
ncbi:hypothetical protein J2W28_006947 [Variovorax boronicumulans]|uniref:hypothetical protein n=1 Tax=Variovorax boronicumulans TaxID=436515 RepID=UPI002786EF74|nr:hypothetical protein [Variovorax boronicumulans]MDP9996474.1 hypothetical protein [Variovorax boronicumulans]MDQ0007768.1 hypothetical protein [Variovorax boronicumulans]